jgi:cell division protease FtsH
MAHDMVAKYGMSSDLGPIAFETSGGVLLGKMGLIERDYSPDFAARIDREVEKIMNESLLRARELLMKYRHVMDAIAEELIRVETLEKDDYDKLLLIHGIKPKRRPDDKPLDLSPVVSVEPKHTAAEGEIIPEKGQEKIVVRHETVVSEHAEGARKERREKRRKKQDDEKPEAPETSNPA